MSIGKSNISAEKRCWHSRADDVPQLNFARDCKVVATDAGVTQVEMKNGKLVLYAESVPSKTLTAELLHKA